MREIVAREELEKKLFDLAAHGFSQNKIDEIRNNFESQFKSEQEIKEDSKAGLMKLQEIKGFKFGKKNKTKFIR